MFIKLTNARTELKGDPVILNTDMIVSIYQDSVVEDKENIKQKTYVYCPPHGTWEIEESPEEILALLNKE